MGVLDRDVSQFLLTGSGYFIEIVLTDASRQADAEQVVRDVANELKKSGIQLDAVVRSLWQIDEVSYVGVARTPEGGIRTALDFRARLRSGQRKAEIRVDVTIAALTVLRQRLGKDEFIAEFGWSPQRGDVDEANIQAAVIAFLELQLRHGGTSYWDPLLDNHLLLNEAAMSYVLGHSTAFQELHTAITDAFSPIVRKNFIGSLALSHVSMADFDKVLPDLSNMLGGAYRRGQRFSVSAIELFNSLTRGEQELLRGYFLILARKARNEQPQLAQEYPSAFANL
jgi:hypothetical protein